MLAAWPISLKTKAMQFSRPTMTVPHYISEDKSDMRGIKHGWYAVEDDGNLSSGPLFQPQGMHQENHSTDKRDKGWRLSCNMEP
jgi:hypothetical protein